MSGSQGRVLESTDPAAEDITLDGFLSSFYINLFMFTSFMVAISIVRRQVPEFFHPRLYSVDDKGAVFKVNLPGGKKEKESDTKRIDRLNAATNVKTRSDGQGPPVIPEKWFGLYWIYFIWKMPNETVLKTVGLDAYMFLRFAHRASQLFGIVCLLWGCGLILPINYELGEREELGFDRLSLSHIDVGQPILWVHAGSTWVFTLSTFAILLELGREFAILRHRYLRYNLYHRTAYGTDQRVAAEDKEHKRQEEKSSAMKGASATAPVASTSFHSRQGERRPSNLMTLSNKLPPWVKESGPQEEQGSPYVLNPRPYTVMVENLPAWVDCDAQLYFFFDFLFPGEVYSVSLVTNASKVDAVWRDRNEFLRSLEECDHLKSKNLERSVRRMAVSADKDTPQGSSATVQDSPSTVTNESTVTMIICPSGTQWLVDLLCCGPFTAKLCCGCYQRVCRCCDDGGKHEGSILSQMEEDYNDSSSDEEPVEVSSRRRTVTEALPHMTQRRCCQKPYRVKARAYLEKLVDIHSQKLNTLRKRAQAQLRRRGSAELVGSKVLEDTEDSELPSDDTTEASAVEDDAESRPGAETKSIDLEITQRPDHSSSSAGAQANPHDKGAAETRPKKRVTHRRVADDTKHDNQFQKFGRKMANVGRGVYDRVAYTTEMITGVDWRTRYGDGPQGGFRPSSTGFVTLRSMTAVSEAVQLSLVKDRTVFDPAMEKLSGTNEPRQTDGNVLNLTGKRSSQWSENEAIVLAKNVTSHIFSPFQAIGDLLDITRYTGVKAKRAPGQEDLYWPHLSVKEQLRHSRRWTTFWITILLQFMYTLLVSAISSLVSVNNLREVVPGLDAIVNRSAFVRGFVVGFLPTLLIEGILALLPLVLGFLSYLEYPQTQSELDMSTAAKYFQFKTWQLMFVFTISGTVFESLNTIINRPKEILDVLGSALPRLSSFYINLVMLRTMSALPFDVLRPFWLILHVMQYRSTRFISPDYAGRRASIEAGSSTGTQPNTVETAATESVSNRKKPKAKHTWQLWDMTRRQYWENILLSGGEFRWIEHFTNALVVFLIGITYSTINPVIAPVAAAFFVNARFVWKYLLLYVHHKSWETGGLVWPRMVRRVSAALVVYQLTMLGILGLKQSGSALLVLPLVFVTYAFDLMIRRRLEEPAMYLSREECQEIDTTTSLVGGRGPRRRVAAFHSLNELRKTELPENARTKCPYSAYERPSLDPKQDWSPHVISLRNVLYY
eukprot:gb/GECG01008165.1/.p1 GENE.gb/GECG01008165.1/~~gb/GECG01008165.1/.p1  ORF type:complete len:1236 (+),score=126.24 gb/GECG01008165.1/:1-3708(+)